MNERELSVPPGTDVSPNRVLVLSVAAIFLIAAGLGLMILSEKNSAANVAALFHMSIRGSHETIDARLR